MTLQGATINGVLWLRGGVGAWDYGACVDSWFSRLPVAPNAVPPGGYDCHPPGTRPREIGRAHV